MEEDTEMFDMDQKQLLIGRAEITRHPGWGSTTLPCWTALPVRQDMNAIPLVAIHGLHRGAKAQARGLAPLANALGKPVIAPLFGQDDWPSYQQVVRKHRADLALLELLDTLQVAGVCRTGKIDLCGYSGGAQFAHRFAMLYPHRIARLTLIAAGWYTFPDLAPFPYGLGAPRRRCTGWNLRSVHDLRPFLSLPITVLVGSDDNVIDDTTRSGPEIDRQQGRTRLERARRWVAAMHQAADSLGITADITLTELDGCGHDFSECLAHPRTQDALFAQTDDRQPQ